MTDRPGGEWFPACYLDPESIMNASQAVSGGYVRASYKPTPDGGLSPDRLTVEVKGPDLYRIGFFLDPCEDAVSLFFGCAEGGQLAPLVDWLQDRESDPDRAEVLARAGELLAG